MVRCSVWGRLLGLRVDVRGVSRVEMGKGVLVSVPFCSENILCLLTFFVTRELVYSYVYTVLRATVHTCSRTVARYVVSSGTP
jgi:hypothetical protein